MSLDPRNSQHRSRSKSPGRRREADQERSHSIESAHLVGIRHEDVKIGQNGLLNMNIPGQVTEDGIRKNLNVGLNLNYMEGWLRGVGCVPINLVVIYPPTSFLLDTRLQLIPGR